MSKVVVVDDEPFILMMIEDKLKKGNIDVVTVRESVRALEIIRREKPDLVILDWMMPEVSGIELCRTIKQDKVLGKIPVFMLTAKGQDSDEQLGMRTGAQRYITKPFSPKVLLEMVREALSNVNP
ncbi:MAG: response regulator [Nitrospirae bacterium]|nr:response regulator [Nitrospirota bacterium]